MRPKRCSKDYRATFPVVSMGLYEHDADGIWQLREELDFGTETDNDAGTGAADAAADAAANPDEPPLPTDRAAAEAGRHPETDGVGQGQQVRRRPGGRPAGHVPVAAGPAERFPPDARLAALQPPARPADERRHRVQDVLLHHRPAGHGVLRCRPGAARPAGPAGHHHQQRGAERSGPAEGGRRRRAWWTPRTS